MFENLKGLQIKVVFKDSGALNKEKAISGRLVNVDDKFLYIQTFQGNSFIVSISSVVTVKELGGVG